MGPKKEKAQKMSLGSFLADTSTGNWADDVQDLPSAPGGFDAPLPTGPRGSAGGDGGFDDRRGGRGLPRGEVVFPTNPPYSAFLGNLSYDISEGDIENLFRDLKIKSLRLMRDIDNNIKGFGYCDFVDLDSLKGAVALHGETVKAKERPGRSGGFGGDRRERGDSRFGGIDDSPADWRNHGRFVPAAAPPPRSPDRERGFGDRFNNRGGDFGEQRRGFGGGFRREDRNEQREGPWERKKLELQPRSAAAEPAGTNSSNADAPNRPSSPVKNKPNPFGQATARDEGEIMRRLEERRQQKEAERKAAEAAARQAKDEEREKTKTIINKPSAPSKVSDSEGSWRRDGPPRVNPSAPAASRHAKDRDFGRKRTSVPAEGSVAESVGTSGEGVKGRKEKAALSPVAAPVAEAKRGNVYDVLNADEGDDL